MKHRPLRIIPIPRKEPDLNLLAQALLALLEEQRRREQELPGSKEPRTPGEATHG